MSSYPIEEIRALFPGSQEQIYLEVSVRGLLSTSVREAIDGYLEERTRGGPRKSILHRAVEQTRAGFAELIGANPDEVAIVKNVSEGLNLFAGSLPWRAGDNVVVCPELEHPNNVFLWFGLRDRLGVEVRALEPDDGGRVPVERMAAALDEHTRVVTVPHMSFSPGFITPLAPLSEATRATGTLLLVDAAQSLGALATDVREPRIDALAVATQKALGGLYGVGFLYVRQEVVEALIPAHIARYGVDLGAGAHETAIGSGELRFQPGARRFDLGNYNYLGVTAAAAALELLRSVGMEAIEAHVRGLAARLAVGLAACGLQVAGGPPGAHLGHIVAVGESGGGRHASADDPAMNDLYEHLTAHGVVLSIRRGVLRFGIGLYNTAEEIDRVIELAATRH